MMPVSPSAAPATRRGLLHSRIGSEAAATAVEYGLMVAAITAVIVAIVVTPGARRC